MSMSVKTVGHLSNKIFDDAELLMTMHVCEEQLSHFLMFSWLVFRRYIICKQIISKEIYGHLLQYLFFSIFKCALLNRVN